MSEQGLKCRSGTFVCKGSGRLLATLQFAFAFLPAFFLWVGGFPASAQQPAFLTNGLVASYLFNGNANDATGRGNNGQTTDVSYGTDRFGAPRASAAFNGASSFVYVTNFLLIILAIFRKTNNRH